MHDRDGYTLRFGPRLSIMEVHFLPDLERKLAELATTTGRAADALVQGAVAGYLDELADIRETLDRRECLLVRPTT